MSAEEMKENMESENLKGGNESSVETRHDVKDTALADPSYFAEQPWLEYVYITVCIMAQILTQAGSNYALSILKTLDGHYGTNAEQRSWFMSSFALTCGTLILVTGRLGDIYGAKLMMLIGYGLCFVWSILAAVSYWDTSHHGVFFVICRAFQGVGVAFLLPNAIGTVGRVYKSGTLKKHIVISLIGWAAPVGGTTATLFAGIIDVRTKYWNWICWMFAIVSVACFVMTWVSVPKLIPDANYVQPGLDLPGFVLGICAMVLFNFVWNQAPSASGHWGNPYIIVLLIVSVLLFVAFIIWEHRFAKDPVLPKRVMDDPILLLVLLALLFSWGAFGIMMYHYFEFLLYFRDYSSVASGAATMTACVTGGIAAISVAFIIRRVPIEFLLVLSMLGFLAGQLILATVPLHETYWRSTFAVFIICPFGMDWSFPAASILLSDQLPAHLQGMSGSLIMTQISYGISLFVGVSGTIDYKMSETHGPQSMLNIRAPMFFATGLAGAAAVISSLAGYLHYRQHHRKETDELEASGGEAHKLEM